MRGFRRLFGPLLRATGLPNSNQDREGCISHARVDQGGSPVPFDAGHDGPGRHIPPCAAEGQWRASDGHCIRRLDFAAPAGKSTRGTLLFLPGRGDFYEKYLETLADWHAAGWQVTAIDWRGQGGSGRLGKDAVTGHVRDFADWINDLADFWREWRAATPGPHVAIGHSMGGHLVLCALAERRIDPAAAVLVAPMLGFVSQRLPSGIMHAAAKAMRALGDPARPAWKWSEKPGQVPASRQFLLTHDDRRYADELWWREMRPELVMGPGSWGWVERAYASMRALARPGVLEAIATPVLLLGAERDRLVAFEAIEVAAARLPAGRLVRFGPTSRHEILREVDAVRDRALHEIAAFLEEVAPSSATHE